MTSLSRQLERPTPSQMATAIEKNTEVSADAFVKEASQLCHDYRFVVDNNNIKVLNLLKDYFNRYRCELDSKKGIMLLGNPGLGKSIIMRTWSRLTRLNDDRFEFVGSKYIADDFMTFGYESILKYSCVTNGDRKKIDRKYLSFFKDSKLNHICIDDLGSENPNRKYMGNDMNVMAELIEKRYDIYQMHGTKTHIISNIVSSDELIKLYGTRAFSRLQEMCNVLVLNGNDRRLQK